MKALLINCTLKPSPAFSNTGALIDKAVKQLKEQGVETEVIRFVDYNVKPGNSSDEGKGDDWPKLLKKNKGMQYFDHWHANMGWTFSIHCATNC